LASDETELLRAAGAAESENRFSEAIEIWRDVRERLVARLGENHWQVFNCDQAIAMDMRLAQLQPTEQEWVEQLRRLERDAIAQSRAGSLKAALRTVNQAKALSVQIFGESAALPLRLHLMAGQLAQQINEWDVADAEYESAVRIAGQLFAPPHPDLELATFRLGIVERQLGQFDRAISLLQEAQQMSERLVGRDATFASRTHELAVAFHRARRWDDALREFELAERIRVEVLGNQHWSVAETRVGQAVVMIDQEQCDAAWARLSTVEQSFSAETPASLRQEVWQHQATIRVIQRDFEDAARLLKCALDSREQSAGRNDRQYAHLAYRLGMCHGFSRRFDQAEPLLRHALQVQSGMLGRSHDDTRKTVQALAMLLQRTQREPEAQELLRQYAYASSTEPVQATQ
jgi:tetratricopeptide (TPR) repeat protein